VGAAKTWGQLSAFLAFCLAPRYSQILQHWPQALQIGIVTSIKGANILVDNKGLYQALQTLVHPKRWFNLQPFLKPSP
jgi:hypothetical protein